MFLTVAWFLTESWFLLLRLQWTHSSFSVRVSLNYTWTIYSNSVNIFLFLLFSVSHRLLSLLFSTVTRASKLLYVAVAYFFFFFPVRNQNINCVFLVSLSRLKDHFSSMTYRPEHSLYLDLLTKVQCLISKIMAL